MVPYVALLRAVNVTGRNPLSMKDLSAVVSALPAENVATYLQSGNVVFRAERARPAAVAAALEEAVAAATSLTVKVLVRTADEMAAVVDANPFVTASEGSGQALHVTFLAAAPAATRLAALKTPESEDRFTVHGREIYLCCPNGYGRTKLNNSFFERKLDVVATTRNWRTVTTLAAMVRE